MILKEITNLAYLGDSIDYAKVFSAKAEIFIENYRTESDNYSYRSNVEINPILCHMLASALYLEKKIIHWAILSDIGSQQTINRVKNAYIAEMPLKNNALYRLSKSDMDSLIFLRSFMRDYASEEASYKFPITNSIVTCQFSEQREKQERDFAEVSKAFLDIPIINELCDQRQASQKGWSR